MLLSKAQISDVRPDGPLFSSTFMFLYLPVSTEFRSLLGFSSQLLTFSSLPHSVVVVPSAQSEEQNADSYYKLV